MYVSKVFFFLLIPLIWGMTPASDEQEMEYIEYYKYLAIDEMSRSGIPASIILAQAMVESDCGRSLLAQRANNHFGIKCKSWWEGEKYYYTDDDRDASGKLIPSCFRLYTSVEESFVDHTEFLVNSDRYRELFNYAKTDYVNWAKGLKACGYATDKRYAHKLINKIEQYDLDEYDYYVVRYE